MKPNETPFTPTLTGFSDRFNEFLDQLGKPLRGRAGDVADLMRDTPYPVSVSATTRWLKNDVFPGVEELFVLIRILRPTYSHDAVAEICKYLTWGGPKTNTNAQTMMAVYRAIALHPRSTQIKSNQKIDAAASVVAEHMQLNGLSDPDPTTVDVAITLLLHLQELG